MREVDIAPSTKNAEAIKKSKAKKKDTPSDFEAASVTATAFRSKVLVQHMETGPQPDTGSFIQKIEQDKLAKQRGETKDNRSCFAK